VREKKFRLLNSMLTDVSEKKLLKDSFFPGEKGNYYYREPSDRTKAERIQKILKKVHKARSGPRVIRLSLLFIVLGVPFVFAVFFMDTLVSRNLEQKLEYLSGTDVGVQGLDIQPFSGRILLDRLSFASKNNPMVDSLVLAGMVADIDWSSVFFRSLVFDKLAAEMKLKVPRGNEAEYPRNTEKRTEENSEGGFLKSGIDLSVLENTAEDLIPVETLNLLQSLRITTEKKSRNWTGRISDESKEISELGNKVALFLNKPLPQKADIQGWTSRIEEGKKLSNEISGKQTVVSEYRREFDVSVRDAEEALAQGKAALNADMNSVQNTLTFNDEMVNGWIEDVVLSIFGPGVAEYYNKISDLYFRFRKTDSEADTKSVSEKGRLKRGRIVAFPFVHPPRFSIRILDVRGDGVVIDGKNVGIDHNLAGVPSTIFFGMEDLLSAEITVDGREGAENLISGTVNTKEWAWSGGLIASDSSFAVKGLNAEGVEGFSSLGRVLLTNWNSQPFDSAAGIALSLIGNDTPPLAFNYEYFNDTGDSDLIINIDRKSLVSWKKMLTDQALSMGTQEFERVLPPGAEEDIKALESVIEDWDDKESVLDNLSSELQSYETEIDKLLDDWKKNLVGDIPLPEASGVLDGVGSLFGN